MASLPELGPAPDILFVTATRIGDAVLSTGVLRHLLERYDRPRLTIAAGAPSASLFRCVPGLEDLIAVNKRRYALHWLELLRQLGFRRWDLALDLRRSAVTWLVHTRHRRIVGKSDLRVHRVVELGGMLAVSPPPSPALWWSAAHDAAARQLVPAEGPVLAIGPGANWAQKQWPVARFAELARRLTAPDAPFAHAPVAVFGAAHEAASLEPLFASLARDRAFRVIGEDDLLTVAAALRRTSLFIGNDSGLMHMAAAVGVPTLGLFGPTSVARYAPWGPHAAAVAGDSPALSFPDDPGAQIQSASMERLTVDRVEAAALVLVRTAVIPAAGDGTACGSTITETAAASRS